VTPASLCAMVPLVLLVFSFTVRLTRQSTDVKSAHHWAFTEYFNVLVKFAPD
jgi:hypothetical protein